MTRQLKSARIGIYECKLSRSFVSKGRWIKGYYGLFRRDLIDSMIMPDLKDAKRASWDFEFPVLVVSYYLGSGDLPKPLKRSPKLKEGETAMGVVTLRRMLDIPARRKKIPKTETWEAVISFQGQVFEVQGHKLKGSSTSE